MSATHLRTESSVPRLNSRYFEELLNVVIHVRAAKLDVTVDHVKHQVRGVRPTMARPFVTLIESVRGDVVPRNVLKVVVTRGVSGTTDYWREVLNDERDNIIRDLKQGTYRTVGVRTVIEPPIRHLSFEHATYLAHVVADDLASAPSLKGLDVAYLVRPYLAWPRLTDLKLDGEQQEKVWRDWCIRKGVRIGKATAEFDGFVEAALVNPQSLHAEVCDSFVTSYEWFVKSRGKSPEMGFWTKLKGWFVPNSYG